MLEPPLKKEHITSGQQCLLQVDHVLEIFPVNDYDATDRVPTDAKLSLHVRAHELLPFLLFFVRASFTVFVRSCTFCS